MLKIQKVAKYDVPKYPKGLYYQKPPPFPGELLKRGAATLAMLALLESCSEKTVGTTGPPPVLPDMVTENEAQQIINQVFTVNGLILENDVPFVLHLGPNDSTELRLDGFNDSLHVGYEYLTDTDNEDFNNEVLQRLDDLSTSAGPYIKVLQTEHKYPHYDYQMIMESYVQEFIDTLKARGVI